MNKEEILNKYIDLIDKGYCSDCNELNCIDNFPYAKITHAIRELQQENQKYKEVIDKVSSQIKLYGKYNGEKCTRGFSMMSADFNKLLDILKEVEK